MKKTRIVIWLASVVVLYAVSSHAQPRTVQHDLWNETYAAVDDEHKALQRRAITPWEFSPSKSQSDFDAVRIAAAQALQKKLTDFERSSLSDTQRAKAIGTLLSDLAIALDTRVTSSEMIAALGRSVKELTPIVGLDQESDLVYAQAIQRLARAYDRPGADRKLVAPTLLEGLQLLRSKNSKVAESALAEAWRPFLKRTSELPGITQVQIFAFGRPPPSNPCGPTGDLQNQVKALLRAGRTSDARDIAADLAARYIEAVRRGCSKGVPEIFATNINTGRWNYEALFEGRPNTISADVAEAKLRDLLTPERSELSRSASLDAPIHIGEIAANGTAEQYRMALMLLPPRMSPTAKGPAVDAELAKRARFAASGLLQVEDFSLAEAVYERMRELRSGARPGSWATAGDAIIVAKFHYENGRRARATELARAVLAEFPLHEISLTDSIMAKIILAQNAIDEGDDVRGWGIAKEVVQLAAKSSQADAETAYEFAASLPRASDAILRVAAIELAASQLRSLGKPKPRPAKTLPFRTQQASLAIRASVRYEAPELLAQVKEFEGADFDLVWQNLGPVWLTTDRTILAAAAAGLLSTSPVLAALKAKNYEELNRHAVALPVSVPDHDCSGAEAVLKLVARERMARREPKRPDIERAIVRGDTRYMCIGNGYFTGRQQLEGQIEAGKFWLDNGEPVVALAYLDYAIAKRYGVERYGMLEVPSIARLPDMAEHSSWLAQALLESGDAEGALSLATKISRGLVLRLTTVGSEADLIRETSRFRKAFDLHIVAAATHAEKAKGGAGVTGAVASAFEATQLARATLTANASARLLARLGAADAQLASLLRQRQDLADIVEREGRAIEDTMDDVRKRQSATRLAEAGREYESVVASISRRYPGLAKQETGAPLKLTEVQAALADGEALFLTHSTSDQVYAFLVTRTTAQLRRVGQSRQAVAQSVDDLRRSLVIQQRMPRFDDEVAESLGNALLGGFATELNGIKHITLVVDGALESLPFAVLTSTKLTQGRRQYLFEKYALSTLPAVRMMLAPRPTASATTASGNFLGVGDPVLEGPKGKQVADLAAFRLRSPEQRVQSIREMAPLPESAEELRQFSRAVRGRPEDLWLGRDASERRLKTADLRNYRLIAFATHAIVAGEVGSIVEPGLILTPPLKPDDIDDGVLTASEVAQLNLSAELVVLSGCNTAASDGRSGADGLSGLTRAFLNAGARNLVVSHWRVGSVATAALMNRFSEELAAGKPSSTALQSAMVAQLKAAKSPMDSHPAFWAPFFVVGRDR